MAAPVYIGEGSSSMVLIGNGHAQSMSRPHVVEKKRLVCSSELRANLVTPDAKRSSNVGSASYLLDPVIRTHQKTKGDVL